MFVNTILNKVETAPISSRLQSKEAAIQEGVKARGFNRIKSGTIFFEKSRKRLPNFKYY